MNDIVKADATSPFDALRRADEHGEGWDARELQPVLGYRTWENFAETIERAKIACRNSGGDVTSNFRDVTKKSTGGRPPKDVRLTRYACYLVAMNGDPRKPAIAAAQTYFAVKTREAEVAKPQSRLDILAEVIAEMQRVERDTVRALETATEAREETRVVTARLDAIEGRHDHYAALGWARLTNWTRTDDMTLARLGRIAGTIGRAQGLEAGKAPHARYGTVNTWPKHVWDEAAHRFETASA